MFLHDLVPRYQQLAQAQHSSKMGNVSHSPTFLPTDLKEEKQSHSRDRKLHSLLPSMSRKQVFHEKEGN